MIDAAIVGDDPRLAQPDAGLVEAAGEKGEVFVLGAAGQDLVADDQHAGGDDLGSAWRGSLSAASLIVFLGLVRCRCGVLHRQSRHRHNRRRGIEDCRAADATPYHYRQHGWDEEHAVMQQDMMHGAGRAGSDGGRIKIHGPEAFEGMRCAGALAAETLDFITPHVHPGVTTGELDRLCHDFIADHDAIPAPLNYRGFPKSICTSVNHVVCHGIPGERRLMEGDILNIDVTADPRRLARRYQPDVPGRRAHPIEGAAARRRDL